MEYNQSKHFDQLAYMIFQIIESTAYPRNIKIQKIIFIYEEEFNNGFFRFGEDNFGPFSTEVASAINILLTNGYIEDMVVGYKLTNRGRVAFNKISSKEYEGFDLDYFKLLLNIFSDWDSDKLIKFVYNKYPQFTNKSIIIDSLVYKEGDYDEIDNKFKELTIIKNKWKKFTEQNNQKI